MSDNELDVIMEIKHLTRLLNNEWEANTYFCDEVDL